MTSNTKLLITATVALAAGFFIAKAILSNGLDLVYDYEDCIKKCDALPQISELKQTRKECINDVPKPNITLCLHVPPQNQQACFERILGEYTEATQHCRDAYDEGVTKLEECWKGCRWLLNPPIKQK